MKTFDKNEALYRRVLVVALLLTLSPCLAEEVPLIKSGGVYMVPVQLNEVVTVNFVVDSGAAEMAIPADVVSTLLRSGTVKKGDYLADATMITADGKEMHARRLLLRNVRVGSVVVRDVTAAVLPGEGEPLLGQSFLRKLKHWSLDVSAGVLVLNDEAKPKPEPRGGDKITIVPGQGCGAIRLGMTMAEVKAILGEPDPQLTVTLTSRKDPVTYGYILGNKDSFVILTLVLDTTGRIIFIKIGELDPVEVLHRQLYGGRVQGTLNGGRSPCTTLEGVGLLDRMEKVTNTYGKDYDESQVDRVLYHTYSKRGVQFVFIDGTVREISVFAKGLLDR